MAMSVYDVHGLGDAVADRKGDGFSETGTVHVGSILPSLFRQRFQCCEDGGDKLDAGCTVERISGRMSRLESFSSTSARLHLASIFDSIRSPLEPFRSYRPFTNSCPRAFFCE